MSEDELHRALGDGDGDGEARKMYPQIRGPIG
jgi:hypothetical protein